MKKVFSLLCSALLAIAVPLFSEDGAQAGASVLQQISDAYTQVADRAIPATVFIKAQISPSFNEDSSNPTDLFGDDVFRRFFGQPFGRPQQQPQLAGGSGFFISADGHIVTNNHVIKDATQITVLLNDGREYPATVKGVDPRTDLAVLKIEEKDLPYLKFGDSDKLKICESVIAIGNPFGLEGTVTVGVVSAKGRQDIGIASYEDFLLTDAAINPGNSGGPLLNLKGEVIGVNTAIFYASGIGLAIPSKMAQNVIGQIIDSGTVVRAYLGVVLQPVDKDLAEAMNLEKQEGVLISDVVKNAPAEKAGLKPGDIILQYNEQLVKNVNRFRNEIALMNPGTELKLKVLRNHKILYVTVILGSQAEGEIVWSEFLQKIGLEIENLSPEMASRLGYGPDVDGVVITKVKAGSPAAVAGLRPSFLITGIAVNWNNQKRIHNTSDLDDAFKEMGDKKHIILIVRHQNFQRYYTIRVNP